MSVIYLWCVYSCASAHSSVFLLLSRGAYASSISPPGEVYPVQSLLLLLYVLISSNIIYLTPMSAPFGAWKRKASWTRRSDDLATRSRYACSAQRCCRHRRRACCHRSRPRCCLPHPRDLRRSPGGCYWWEALLAIERIDMLMLSSAVLGPCGHVFLLSSRFRAVKSLLIGLRAKHSCVWLAFGPKSIACEPPAVIATFTFVVCLAF